MVVQYDFSVSVRHQVGIRFFSFSVRRSNLGYGSVNLLYRANFQGHMNFHRLLVQQLPRDLNNSPLLPRQ